MSSQIAIPLNTLVYNPAGTDRANYADWVERSGGYGSSFSHLKQKFYPVTPAGVQRIEHNLNVPVVATTSDTCACVGSLLFANYANINVGLGKGATQAQRLDLYNRIKDLVADPAFKASIVDLDPAY